MPLMSSIKTPEFVSPISSRTAQDAKELLLHFTVLLQASRPTS